MPRATHTVPARHPKRYGHHQRHSRRFLKTYAPFLPLLTIIAVGLTFGIKTSGSEKGVLAYATNVSAASLLQETNTQRNSTGGPALTLNEKLNQAAQAKATDMVNRNYWSHTAPDGTQPWAFLDRAGYAYQKAGENLAYGFRSSEATVVGWMNSPTHKENLLDSSFEEVGFGFANAPNYQGDGPNTIIVALYGRASEITGGGAAPSTNQAVRADTTIASNLTPSRTYQIARIQIITNGKAPWSIWAFIGIAMVGLAIVTLKHSLALRRVLVKGERYVLKHPLFDITVASFVFLCFFISRVEGYILSASF